MVVVGGGPVGILLRLLVGGRRLGRGRGREEALPPGQDLRGRADPPGGAAAGRHGPRRGPGRLPQVQRAPGLRLRPVHRDAVARAPQFPQLRLHHHPPRPRRPGGRAGRQGRSHPFGRDRGGRSAHRRGGAALILRPAPAARRHRQGQGVGCRPARSWPATSWWPTAPTPRVGRMLGTNRRRDLPLGMALRGLLHLGPPRRSLHRVPSGHSRRRGQHRPRLRLDLPHGRRPGQRRRRPPLHRSSAGRGSTPRT